MKILNSLFVFFVIILVVMSLLALVIIHATLFKYTFSLTPAGLNTYLNEYKSYSALFAGTIATTGGYLGLLRLHAATNANRDKLKQDRFSEWKTVFEIRALETEKKDPFMKREFVRLRWHFFNELYKRNFTVANKNDLTTVLSIFKTVIPFFEEQSNDYVNMGGVYRDANSSYSVNSFVFLFLGLIDISYNEIELDLRGLYISYLPQNRIVGEALYHSAYSRHYNLA